MVLFFRDLRFGLRSLRGSPWYAFTTVSVLAIGIGLTTVAFAIADGVLFKPLPYSRPAELYLIRPNISTAPQLQPLPASWSEVEAWVNAVPDLRRTVVTHSSPMAAAIDERFFEVIGTRPLLGGFSPGDFDWFADFTKKGQRIRPVLLSYRYWQTRYGGDTDVIGRTIVDTHRETFVAGIRIAGVLPPEFVFPLDNGRGEPEMIGALARELRRGNNRDYHVIARLGAPASPREVANRLTAAARELREAGPPPGHAPAELLQRKPFDDVQLVALSGHLARHERPALALVLAAAGLLLLLACINVAGLVASRNIERQRALQVRTALGAAPRALVRELLGEITPLATAAAGLAVLFAKPLLVWTVQLLPSTVVLLKAPAIDLRVFLTAMAVTLATLILVTLWPARVAVRLGGTVRFEGADAATRRLRRFARPLVMAQVSAGFVLLTAGGLTLSSLAAAWRNDTGFRRDRMLLLELSVSHSANRIETVEKLAALPALIGSVAGVETVAMSTMQPMFAERRPPYSDVAPEGWVGEIRNVISRQVSSNYFEVMEIRLLDGRWPTQGEWNDGRVAIVSQSAARTFWPDRPPLGRTLIRRTRATTPPATVIGVVADARYLALDEDPFGDVYLPGVIESGRYGLYFHVRTSGPAAAVLGPVLAALAGRGYRVDQASTHEDALFASVKHRALPAWLFGTFGLAALVVLGAGIYGLLAMSAAQRTREVGIRVALGATRARLISLLIREQMPALALGLGAGALASWWSVGILQSQLYGTGPHDAAVWSSVAVLIIVVALLATLIPAVRAVRSDPVTALRAE